MSERGGTDEVVGDRRKRAIVGACAALAVLAIAVGVLGITDGGSRNAPAAAPRVGARVFDAQTTPHAPSTQATPDVSPTATGTPAADSGAPAAGSATAAPVPAPIASLNATALDFGSQNVGESNGVHFVTLTNQGNPVLHVRSVTSSAASFGLEEGACDGATLAAGQSCPIGIRFTPTSAGPLVGTITVADDASPSTQTVSVRGTGTTAGASVSATSLAFSGQPSTPVTVTVTSTGSGPLNIVDIFVTGTTPDFVVSSNTCIGGHPPGTQCTFQVNAAPPSGTTTPFQGTLQIYDDAGGGQSIALSWTPGATTTTTTTSSAT